jgi:uncharacterized protein YyaL (SSP411 family)
MTVEGCLKEFIHTDSQGRHILRHTNTIEQQALYLEDYVNFTEAQLRLYEITGNETFKKNTLESVDFVLKNFVEGGEIYVTSLKKKTIGIENLKAPLYDQSYRSSSMALINLLYRLSVLKPELSPENIFGEKMHEFIQHVLVNPLGHGEGLRALTYPGDIFRRIEVPVEWLKKPEFLQMRSHFFSRFVLDYHSRDNHFYQICTIKSCELSGEGFENFKALFQTKDDSHA